MVYGKLKSLKNAIKLENRLDNQKDSNPNISNSKEKNLHNVIVNESNKNTQKKKMN